MSIKALREAQAKLNSEEVTLRKTAKATYDKARAESRALTDAEKTADDATKTRLSAIETERADLAAEIENEEKLLAAERLSVPAEMTSRIAVKQMTDDDPKRGFRDLADFAQEVMNAGPGRQGIDANPRLMAAAGTGMVQGVTAEGGVLVPPAFSTSIWDGARKASESMLGYCDTMTIDAGVQSLEIPAINETSRADGSRWGGIRGYWKGELSSLTSSKAAFRSVKLEPHELYVFAYVSDKLLKHAPQAATQILTRAAADEINFKIGDAIWNGDGAGKPRGVIGHASVVSVAKETNQAAATILRENIDKMWARCHSNWRSNAVWFVNQDVEPQLEQLSASVGTGGVPIYLPAGGIADTPNARLKGRPVVVTEYNPTLGTVGDIVLANFDCYMVGLRGGIDSKESMHLKFDYAQTAFRFIFEVDGQPALASAITPFKGSNTLSPIVTLATRS